MHVVVFVLEAHGAGYLEVGEAVDLGLAQQVAVESVDVAFLQPLVDVDDVLELIEEPLVNLRQVVNLVDGVALVHGLGDNEHTLVGGVAQGLIDVGNLQFLVLHIAVHALANHTQALLNGFLEVAANGHHLADRLHA